MVKVMKNDPMFKQGAYKNQKGDGLYFDEQLVNLIDIYTRQIVNDMQFTGIICSSTSGVRVGKSTVAQQIAYYYTSEINRKHNLNLTFTKKNIVFRGTDLIKRAHELPRYSCIILDEGDDLTDHAMSTKMKELQMFLRKSGMLNLFIIFILPNYFDLPKSIAVHRTNFLIDVKFEAEFDRGFFSFFNSRDKQFLYMKGKKFNDYLCQRPTLPHGRFVDMYTIPRKEYDQMKLDDLKRRDREEKEEFISKETVRKVESQLFVKVYNYLKEHHNMTIEQIAKAFGRTRRTGTRYIAQAKKENVLLEYEELNEEPQDSEAKVNDTKIGMLNDDGGGNIKEAAAVYPDPITPPQLVQDKQSESPLQSSRIYLNSFESLKNNDNEKEERTI